MKRDLTRIFAEMLQPRAIICPAGLFECWLSRLFVVFACTPNIFVDYLYGVFYRCLHRTSRDTKTPSYQLHTGILCTGEINETLAKRSGGETKGGKRKEKERSSTGKNVEVAPRCSRSSRFSWSRSTNANSTSHTFPWFSVLLAVVPATFFPQLLFSLSRCLCPLFTHPFSFSLLTLSEIL